MLCLALSAIIATATAQDGKREYYEWRYYSIVDGKEAELDKFLEKVLLPAYERQGVESGVFEILPELLNDKQKELQAGRPEQRIVLFIYDTFESYLKTKEAIWEDGKFTRSGKSYFEKWTTDPAYSAMESYLCLSFENFPKIAMPKKSDKLFELRRYRSANEEAAQRKITMFNVDEIDLFDDVKITQVCYGEVLAGGEMPSLIYLTSYKNNNKRIDLWKDFSKNKRKEKIFKQKEYLNTVRNSTIEVVQRMPYSKFCQ